MGPNAAIAAFKNIALSECVCVVVTEREREREREGEGEREREGGRETEREMGKVCHVIVIVSNNHMH